MARASDSIAVGLTIDITQGLLTLLLVGIVLNPIISLAAGIAMARSKNTQRILITTFGEMIPFINVMPLWTLSAIIGKYATAREERALHKKKAEQEAADKRKKESLPPYLARLQAQGMQKRSSEKVQSGGLSGTRGT